MRSSYNGFGFSSLANDANDIASFVNYLRGLGKQRIVLMGHSTGCQDCIEYSNKDQYPDSPAADGYMLLAPVSDREMSSLFVPPDMLKESVKAARALIDQGRGQDVMRKGSIPELFQSPVTAYRWYSLAAEVYVMAQSFLPLYWIWLRPDVCETEATTKSSSLISLTTD